MKTGRQKLLFGGVLFLSTLLLYALHYYIFRDARHILIYFLGDIAFIPIEVLLVSLVIHRLLLENEKRSLLQKLNMVIGSFYSEAGTELLKLLSGYDENFETNRRKFLISADWNKKDFERLLKETGNMDYSPQPAAADLCSLKEFLSSKRNFILLLLENPNLMEHDAFTDLLWAILHLSEELALRKDLRGPSRADSEHLALDVRRAYLYLLAQWIKYMQHLKEAYPYLYSLSVRTNPFNPDARVEIV